MCVCYIYIYIFIHIQYRHIHVLQRRVYKDLTRIGGYGSGSGYRNASRRLGGSYHVRGSSWSPTYPAPLLLAVLVQDNSGRKILINPLLLAGCYFFDPLIEQLVRQRPGRLVVVSGHAHDAADSLANGRRLHLTCHILCCTCEGPRRSRQSTPRPACQASRATTMRRGSLSQVSKSGGPRLGNRTPAESL